MKETAVKIIVCLGITVILLSTLLVNRNLYEWAICLMAGFGIMSIGSIITELLVK